MRFKAHLHILEDEEVDVDGESVVGDDIGGDADEDDIDIGDVDDADDDIDDDYGNEVNRALPINSLVCWMANIGNLHKT